MKPARQRALEGSARPRPRRAAPQSAPYLPGRLLHGLACPLAQCRLGRNQLPAPGSKPLCPTACRLSIYFSVYRQFVDYFVLEEADSTEHTQGHASIPKLSPLPGIELSARALLRVFLPVVSPASRTPACVPKSVPSKHE